MRQQAIHQKRQGTVIPLAGILLVFLLGMVAFSVDMGYVVLSESELQAAADSAALAGAGQLLSGFVQYHLPGQSTANQSSILTTALAGARTAAKNYAGYNGAGGVASLTLNDSDITFGFTDAGNNYTPQPTYTGFPNTCKVVLRRDSSANGSLALFFAPVLGIKTQSLQASAAATIEGGTINSFSAPPAAAGLLPLTYDVNNWKGFLATGKDPDGNTNVDTSGNPVLQVYPSVSASGNFGQLSLDDNHAGESTEAGWMNNGISQSDLNVLLSAKLIPLSAHDSTKWDWTGDTGMKQSLVSTINSYAGQTFLLPLFNPYTPAPSYSAGTGQGSHYYYQIVQFVAVTIVTNTKGAVWVQPSALVEPNAILININPAGTGTNGSSVTTFSTAKLSQ